ncbi:MAG: metal-dependent hydrolase [Burkholderiaceae bacterium]
MDSVTQMALGAAVGVAVMGKRQPVWRSALLGAVAGTLPDLDALIDFGDGISNMVRHRGETHSFFWQTLAAPLIAFLFAGVTRSLNQFFRWWVMVWLVLCTHAGLDAMTVYGTQLFLPRDDTPVGLGSIFIVDPLYTLPLIMGVIIAIWSGRKSRFRWNLFGLILSTAYLGWTAYAQHQVTQVVAQTSAASGLPADRILVTPTPLNSVLWRIVLMHPDRYEEGYYSLLDPFVAPEQQIRFTAFSRDEALDAETADVVSANRIRRFSKGFYTVSEVDSSVRITDLRMGQYPFFVFSFEFARLEDGRLVAVPSTNVASRENLQVGRYLDWLFARARVKTVEPPSLGQ